MFITYIHRTWESRNTKNTYGFLVQVRNFLLPLSLKVLRHKERDTHSFYSGFSICPYPNTCGTRHKATGLASASKRKSTLPVRCQVLNSTDFFKIPKILRSRFQCMTSFISTGQPLSGIFILTSVNDTSSPHARQHLCSSLHLTNTCAEPKGSRPN